MAQYIVHPAEAGASAADRFGLGMLQGLSEQTSNFVNNAAMQLRQLQEQKASADRERELLGLGINPAGGALPYTALGRTSSYLLQPGRDLNLARMGLLGRTLTGGRVAQPRLFGWESMDTWPSEKPGSATPYGGTPGMTFPTGAQLLQYKYGE